MAKVVVDKNYQPVKNGGEPAFVFNADDPRLEKYQKAAGAAPKSSAKSEPADEEQPVERVGRSTRAEK